MGSIEIAVVGIGNCACSLIQGIEYYSRDGDEEHIGLMHYGLGGSIQRKELAPSWG